MRLPQKMWLSRRLDFPQSLVRGGKKPEMDSTGDFEKQDEDFAVVWESYSGYHV